MHYHRLPGTDLQVSALCFGTAELGTRVRGAEADRVVAAFVEAGGNFFDTAHCYAFWLDEGLGASERELGAALRRLGCSGEAVIATKGGHPDNGEKYRRPDLYLAPEVIAADVQESLERLARSPIDIYYLHRDDTRVPVGEVMGALNREVAAGHVRVLGASNWSAARLAEANQYAVAHSLQGFIISQVQWSLAEPNWEPGPDPVMRFVTAEEIAFHTATGLPIAAYSSCAAGYFARECGQGGSFDDPVNRARHARACQLAESLNCTPTQIALAWLLHQAPLTIPIVGSLNVEHLREALGALQMSLTADEVKWLRDQ